MTHTPTKNSEVWTTTLNKIKEHEPCPDGWAKLLKHLGKTEADDDPVSLLTILESNGLHDALWALRAVDGHDKEIRLFACDCAERVLPIYEKQYPNDSRVRDCIAVARRFAEGEATENELRAARDAARAARDAAWDAGWTAARAAARDAAWDAADAAWDAADAAWDAGDAARDAARAAAWTAARDAAGDKDRKAQEELFIKMASGKEVVAQ